MVRKLPWAKDSPARRTTTTTSEHRSVKRQRVADAQKTDDIAPQTSTPVPSTPTRRRLRDDVPSASATPSRLHRDQNPRSSSPVITSPPSEHTMRPGFEHDDIYIMVEDEFQAVAQQFTAHLHRAEYKRMHREAEDRAKERGDGGVTEILRPTDGKTRMRAETVRKVQAREGERKRKRGVDDVVGREEDESEQSESEAAEEDDGNEIDRILAGTDKDKRGRDEEEEEQEDLQWAGTTLHGLMISPKKSHRSLLGLNGLKTNTRASAGYRNAATSPSKTAAQRQAEYEAHYTELAKKIEEEDRRRGAAMQDEVKQRSRDRTFAGQTHQSVARSSKDHSTLSRQSSLPDVGAPRSPPNGAKKESKRVVSSPRRRLMFDDGFDEIKPEPVPFAKKAGATTRKTGTIAQGREMKNRKDDIPLFL